MKILIQRVKSAEVLVKGESVGKIGPGLLLFLGIGKYDTGEEIEYLVKKISDLRIFENAEKKFDLSLKDVKGEALVVSQFTLCGACEKGRRPDFFAAAEPFKAKEIYDRFVGRLKEEGIKVETGKFGAYMQVKLENDGPATFMLERENKELGITN
jgi:D-aminoacyl-tRNA deacylase